MNADDSEMSRRVLEHDWARTPLGPAAQWPQALKAAVRLLLGSRYPMFVWWGESFTQVYNDAYIDVLGPRHPQALGASAREVWSDVWPVVGPQAEAVLHRGESTWNDRQLLVMQRKGFAEETYFTFSYSPAFDDCGGVGGVFCVCTDDTGRVVGERRLRALSALANAVLDAHDAQQACSSAVQALAENPHDLPLLAVWLADEKGAPRLVAGAGVDAAALPATPPLPDEAGADADAARSPRLVDLGVGLAAGPWPEAVTRALLLPLVLPGAAAPAGWLMAGISPRRPLDDDYRDWLALVAARLASAVADARAFEAERTRAEALAEIDRAKTAFFTNVSHEFRTPLSLMLGPLEDLRSSLDRGAQRELAHTALRNARRLLRLVNTLLDFARVEGGRLDARFEPVDLAAFTAELASTFRSACDRAALELRVHAQPLREPVYVDREMWEKVVLNLLSNAFKFTLEGGILVVVREAADGSGAELVVADTGVGIPASELPRLFERFRRIDPGRGRSFEGSGIGLALVHELVKLHGGSIGVDSVFEQGTTFTVRLPFGAAHLPPRQVVEAAAPAQQAASSSLAASFVGEALQWLPQRNGGFGVDSSFGPLQPAAAGAAARLLVADDNADMRAYLARLLGSRYIVATAADGEQALAEAIAQPPDLVLTDAMMPRLDGFGLIAALRADPRTRLLPVMLLSARAGEESRIVGIAAGADDYVIKPFSSRELLARVAAQLAAARVRRDADAALRASEALLRRITDLVPFGAWTADAAGRPTYVSPLFLEMTGLTSLDEMARGWHALLHPEDAAATIAGWQDCIEQRTPWQRRFRIRGRDGRYRAIDARAIPVDEGADGRPGWIGFNYDVTERHRAETVDAEQKQVLEAIASGAPLAQCLALLCGSVNRIAPDLRALVVVAEEDRRSVREVAGAGADDALAAALGQGLRGAPIGEPPAGTCARAIAGGVSVRCDDIGGGSGEWSAGWRALCLAHGVRACRSLPAFGSGGEAVASMFLCLSEPRELDAVEIGVAEFCAHAAGIAIERDRAAQALHGLHAKQQYLLELTDALRLLHDPQDMLTCAARLVGERLAVQRVTCFELQAEHYAVQACWAHGAAPLHGRYPVDSYGAALLEAGRTGRTLVSEEVAADPRFGAAERDALAALAIGAFINAPLAAGTGIAVHSLTPRRWTALEVEIVAETAERAWAAVERARASAALHAERERLRALFEQTVAGVALVGLDGRIVDANTRFCQIVGRDRETLRGIGLLEMTHPHDVPRNAELLDALLAGRLPSFSLEKRYRRPDGSAVWVRKDANLVRDARGQPRHVAAVVVDITERRLADERLRLVMDAVPALVAYVDADCRYRFNNRSYRDWFGLEPGQIEGRPMREVLGDAAYETLRPHIEAALAGETVQFEAEVPYRHGGSRFVHAEYVADRSADGGVDGFYVFVSDISERKRAEIALRDSESRFRTMADTAPAMLWVTDTDNQLSFISRGWMETTGQSEAEAYRDGSGWTLMVHPEDRAAGAQVFTDAAAARQPFELEYRLRRADGSYRWAIDAGRPRFGDDGAWLGYIGSVIDVHERTEARQALREADRRKDEFLAMLAHELRNPLAPIRNALHLLAHAGGSAGVSERVHEMLQRQVNHLVRLVDDLMEASRIQRGQLELRRQPLELADVLRTAIETSQPLIDHGRHRLDVVLPDEPLPVDGDAVRLAQVFANLLNNAARYTDDGGHIELSARRIGEQVQVSVRDSGIGIAAEQMPRLFEMFAQLDRQHDRARSGLGIGLALVQRLVQLHGGSVHASSEGPGHGSTFTVRLPLAQPAGAASGPAQPAEALPAQQRILVVDDNRDAADSLGMLLHMLGAQVRVEHGGAAAIDAVHAWRPAVVLLDLGMPGIDGYEVARRLRADPRSSGITLVALTGWGQDDDRQRTRAAGFDHHLIKPVDLDVLQALLATLQRAKRAD